MTSHRRTTAGRWHRALPLLFVLLVGACGPLRGDVGNQGAWGDQGDGTFKNPILPGDFSDPDVIRVGTDYYLITSTFQYQPGMAIMHSKDLVNWQYLGHCIPDIVTLGPELNWNRMNRYDRGVYAGALRYHAGKFWMYFTTMDEGVFLTTAERPEGPWSQAQRVADLKNHDDPCPFWDDDGKAYLLLSAPGSQWFTHLYRMTPDGRSIDPASDRVLDDFQTSEGNKLYKIDGTYFVFHNEVRNGRRVGVMMRSKSLEGPWEKKTILEDAPGKMELEPNQGGLVQTATGDWWFITQQGRGAWEGRASSLLPVRWVDGWPIPGTPDATGAGNITWHAPKPIEGFPAAEPQCSDEFNSSQHDDVCLSGGLADREFGHWMKTLQPGESLVAPPAVVSCVQGSLDDLCDRLTATQQRAVDLQPPVEQDLPIVFNEWCTTWGDPQHDKVLAIADRLRGSDVRFLVIDAGWYKADGADWNSGHGDWIPNPRLFPHGMKATADAIRERGLILGLWYEMETVGSRSAAFGLVEHLLRRDGQPVTVRERRFWDLNDPWAVEYLTARVIDVLDSCGFGYLKVDYNETLGLGSEHPDGLGEGLRQQVLASHHFFETLRARLPHLVIENCASGGHRLEPSMLARTAMSSFSDAHELVEIPIIAANLHRLMLPRQSQVWAVLHRADPMERLAYSLAATFLGRMCLSGEIAELDADQWQLVRAAQTLYRRATPVIKHGSSRRFGSWGESWRHPRGWQGVLRLGDDGRSALAVLHIFGHAPSRVDIPLPPGEWNIGGRFPNSGGDLLDGAICWSNPGEFRACVLLLSR